MINNSSFEVRHLISCSDSHVCFFAWFECPDVQKPRENIRKLTKHKKNQPYVFFPRSFFNRVPLGYAVFFLSDILGFCMFAKKCKKPGGNKKTIPALCSNGSCSSVLFVFCFLNFFFARLPRRTKYSENTKRPNYPKLLWALIFFAIL